MLSACAKDIKDCLVILTDPLPHLKLQTLPLHMIAVTTVHCPAFVVLMVATMRVFAP